MNISHIIAQAEVPAVSRQRLELITAYPDLCILLEKFHEGIDNLKPATDAAGIDKDALSSLVFTLFPAISGQLKSISDPAIKSITVRLMCSIRQMLVRSFDGMGGQLDSALKKIIRYRCNFCDIGSEDFSVMYIAETKGRDSAGKLADTANRATTPNYLKHVLNDLQLAELESQLKLSGWFIKPVNPLRIFKNCTDEIVGTISPKREPNVAWLLHELRRAKMIETKTGKGYMEEAAKHLSYNGKPVKAHSLNSLNTIIRKNRGKYSREINSVKVIIDKLKTLEKRKKIVL